MSTSDYFINVGIISLLSENNIGTVEYLLTQYIQNIYSNVKILFKLKIVAWIW